MKKNLFKQKNIKGRVCENYYIYLHHAFYIIVLDKKITIINVYIKQIDFDPWYIKKI